MDRDKENAWGSPAAHMTIGRAVFSRELLAVIREGPDVYVTLSVYISSILRAKPFDIIAHHRDNYLL